ncbi:hypothetical protein ABCW43_00070 [Neorhizobium sp. IRAMC:178]|uniref:hypothetical protein n=1 Tax=Neorhizobium tunisiense TaxID=3144793 RepID=UPI0031F708C9
MSGLELVGSLLGAAGTIAAGQAEKKNQDYLAKQEEMRGQEEFAASQREAGQQRKEADLAMSRAQALAASSGGGAGTDAPTIVKIMSDTAGQGELNAGTTMYGGISRRSGLYDSAKGRRAAGKASLMGSVLSGFGQAASGIGKAFPKGSFG